MQFHIDARSFERFGSALRTAAPALVREVRDSSDQTAEAVASDAGTRASYSTRIPGSIRVETDQDGSASVVAGGPQALDAVVLEHRGLAGTFRHPVYGNYDVIVDQQARPFLHPALTAKEGKAKELAAKAVLETFRLIQVETEV